MHRRFRLASIIFAASVTFSAASGAQAPVNGLVQFVGDMSANGSINGFQVGPYLANLTGYNAQMGVAGPTMIGNAIIWCVDYNHNANSATDTYFSTAFASNTGGIVGNGDFSKTRAGNALKYRQAAWLAEQYEFSGDPLYTALNVQGSMWALLGSPGPAVSGFTLLTAPTGNFALQKDWYVLSDNPCDAYQGSSCTLAGLNDSQEYLTSRARVVPEPGTYAMMALGLGGVAFAARRRRQQSANRG